MTSPRAGEIILDARDSGLGAGLILVAAGRTRNTERTDDFVAGLDRDPAGEQRDVGQRRERGTGRVAGDQRGEGARRVEAKDRPERYDRVGLAERRRGGVDG